MSFSNVDMYYWRQDMNKCLWKTNVTSWNDNKKRKTQKQHQTLIRDFANWSLNFTTFVDHAKNRSMLDGAFKHNLDPMGRIFERANIQEFKCPVYCRRGRERDVEASIYRCVMSVHQKKVLPFFNKLSLRMFLRNFFRNYIQSTRN